MAPFAYLGVTLTAHEPTGPQAAAKLLMVAALLAAP